MAQQIDATQEIDDDNLIKIFIATDNHLGYEEKNPIRGEDSFIAFEEILQQAVVNQVDFILLGGDLFHDANPTTNSLNRCMTLLKKYTLGDKPIMLEFLSDQGINFGESNNKTVNFQDPNINVAIPVFSIHGNHDDPSGFGRLSSLDILATNGLINYFGKWTDLTNIEILPLLMKKGDTRLAIFGLSYIHDNRLNRLFSDSKVMITDPSVEEEDWFNIMVLHQNRADRGPKNFLPEEVLPEFLDFVLWGHEHDCRIEPEENSTKKFVVCQPGSSVATSLCVGEAIEKHCGILMVHKKHKKLEKIKLKTVRPFVFETIDLANFQDEFRQAYADIQTNVQNFVAERIEAMLVKAREQLTDDARQPKEPLIRLRLLYVEEHHVFNTIRFGQQYTGIVANPTDMVVFKKKIKREKNNLRSIDESAMDQAFNKEGIKEETRVEDIVDRYFDEVEGSEQLEVLFSQSLSELCRRLVCYDDDDAAERIINFHKEAACKFLFEKFPSEENFEDEFFEFRDQAPAVYKGMLEMLDKRAEKDTSNKTSSIDLIDMDMDESPIKPRTSRATSVKTSKLPDFGPSTSALPSRGRGSRGGGRGRGKAVVAKNVKSELNFSTNGSSKNQTISESFSRSRSQRITSKPKTVVYDLSSDSDTQ